MKKPQMANFCLEERKNKAGSLIIEYWVVCMPGTFNGIDRLGFSGSRQLCVTQSCQLPQVPVERSRWLGREIPLCALRCPFLPANCQANQGHYLQCLA